MTREYLEGLIIGEVNTLRAVDLRRLDDQGARIYLLTDADGDPEFYISWGHPSNRVFHEWPENQPGAKTHEDWECAQEFKTKPKELRAYLLECLTTGFIDSYLCNAAESEI